LPTNVSESDFDLGVPYGIRTRAATLKARN
jgi:hypothetical protein